MLVAATFVVTACGGDDESGGGEDRTNGYTEAMAKSMADDEELPFAARDIDCLSIEFVDALGGADRLREEGIEPEELRGEQGLGELGLELGDEEAEGIAQAFGECDVSLSELVLAEAGEDVPKETRSCVEENLDEELLADFFAQVLVTDSDGGEPPEALLEPLVACFEPG
jgi:hypothetical protein